MKYRGATTWLVLVGMLAVSSGAALAVHERVEHRQGCGGVDGGCDPERSDDSPSGPRPGDWEDCRTCFELIHARVLIDSGGLALLGYAAVIDEPPAPGVLVGADGVGLPVCRGPPGAHF